MAVRPLEEVAPVRRAVKCKVRLVHHLDTIGECEARRVHSVTLGPVGVDLRLVTQVLEDHYLHPT